MNKFTALFQSRRFWAAASALIAIVASDTLGIDETQVESVVLIVAAWIIGDTFKDTVVRN